MKTGRLVGGAVAAAVTAVAAHTVWAWATYGHVRSGRRPPETLLDRFLPAPEVDEHHHVEVRADPATTWEAARQLSLHDSPLVTALLWLRALPSIAGGTPFDRGPRRPLVDEVQDLGWGILAEDPRREIVLGAYTQPWHQEVTFSSLPPEDFAAFDEPGFVKIAWNLRVEPTTEGRARFSTCTRVVATDPVARIKFRRYWAPMSIGIILIRYATLPLVKRAAERAAREAGQAPPPPGRGPVARG